MKPASIVKFRVKFVSEDVPDDPRTGLLCDWCVRFNENGLTPSFGGSGRTLGNLSYRLRPNEPPFVITGSTLMSKQDLAPSDLVSVLQCDPESNTVCASGVRDPSSESLMHFEIYKQRGDVGAIFHGHDKEISACGSLLNLPETERFEPPGTKQLMQEVMKVLGNEKFVVMKDHGFLALGRTMDEAGNLALDVKREIGRRRGRDL